LNHFTFPSNIFTTPFSWVPHGNRLNYAETFGWQPVFAHKKTALAVSAGLCGLLFCTLLTYKNALHFK
jgi:hypothetical protein